VVTVTLILPTSWVGIASVRRLRKKPPNQCIKCGYNLTGNISGICPECGTAMAGKVGT
jgi:hypothetical protein